MMETALAFLGEKVGGIDVAPSIQPGFYDTDGALHTIFIDVVDGEGCSPYLALCFEDCTATQVTVPIIKPDQDPK